MHNYERALSGRQSKAAGELWEQIIGASCRYYSQNGIAEICKTPEPMKPLGKRNGKGQFLACFTKQAQPDYKGTLSGGRAVVFEAKHTDSGKLKRSAVSEEQEAQLDRHAALGAECFVMASFGFERFFKIPWTVFSDMKNRYGRKYVTPEDLPEYEIDYVRGILFFL